MPSAPYWLTYVIALGQVLVLITRIALFPVQQ